MTPTDTKALTVTRHLAVPLSLPEKNEKQEALVKTLNDLERLEDNFVALMRQYARVIAENSGFVSIDNLRIVAENLGVVPTHPNSWGAVFRGPHWKIVGRQKSALPSNHHREIRVWEWVP